jgi:hypothetical protein
MPLDRPPRPPAGAITERVRRAILRGAQEQLELKAPKLLSLHTEAEYLASARDLLTDLDERYKLNGALDARVSDRLGGMGQGSAMIPAPDVSNDQAAGVILLELPDTEFLTAVENAVQLGHGKGLFGGINAFSGYDEGHPSAEAFVDYVDQALAAHGTPYRRTTEAWRFEWIGDPGQHELVVRPALQALDGARLVGARAEFEEALRKRRLGAAKDLEDAIDEAAKSVESMLKVLHDEHNVTRPRSEQLTPLFNSLVAADVLPGYVDKLVAGAAGPRNNMASHGQGSTVREVPEELADASIAAAATAITLLAHYLP